MLQILGKSSGLSRLRLQVFFGLVRPLVRRKSTEEDAIESHDRDIFYRASDGRVFGMLSREGWIRLVIDSFIVRVIDEESLVTRL